MIIVMPWLLVYSTAAIVLAVVTVQYNNMRHVDRGICNVDKVPKPADKLVAVCPAIVAAATD